ncbi:Co2+/Mg2+ efflux protein ApaG [bacterium]|nr:Co2+/Mg2+ efflux protein ApaG [Pseudomonadales bacterium]MDC0559348.1 Co2+/Mg2+ efflux protein ApaG [bacterium]
MPTIEVNTAVHYLEGQSAASEQRYVFAYRITLRNAGSASAQLLSRHWVITDATGAVEEVRGEGVIGEQPLLNPGEEFEYTSGTMLKTPVGTMQGEYTFVDDHGQNFEVPIPVFLLSAPNLVH